MRKKIIGTKKRPRLIVYRSNKSLYAQIIDDSVGKTLLGLSDKVVRKGKEKKLRLETAFLLGEELAGRAKKLKITTVVFDKSKYRFHGRVKSLAEGARKGGLKF